MFSQRDHSAIELGPSPQTVKHLCASIALGAVLCGPASAQVPAQSSAQVPPQTSAPSVLANANLNASSPQVQAAADEVLIDLVVRDKKQKPILNFTPADIAVSDVGKPVQLSDLHLVTPQSNGAPTIALYFDRMQPDSAKVARDIAGKLIVTAPSQSSFAVLGLDGGLRLFQNFTQDRTAVKIAAGLAMNDLPAQALTDAEKQLNSVVKTGAFPSGQNAGVEDRARARIMLSALAESQRTVQDQHVPAALAGLEALAKAQQNSVGRKIIVFFSAGLRADSKTANMTKEVVEAANRAGICIYTVDTNAVDTKSFDVLTMMYAPTGPIDVRSSPGVTGDLHAMNVNRVSVMGEGGVSDAYSPSERAARTEEGNALAALATGTGGFSISAGDDLREPLKRLVSDISTYYEAFYTPAIKDYDGQFHSVQITPLREGATIRSGAGYFALAPDAAGSFIVRPFEAPLLKILSVSPLPADVGFQQAVLRLGGNATQTVNDFAIEVPLSNVELRQDEHTLLYSAHISVLAQIRDKSGTVVERFSEDISRNGALETIDAARADVVTLQRHFSAAPGNYVLEAVVLDNLGGKAGAQRTEFTIPAQTDGPWLSDVALVRRTEPLSGTPDSLNPTQDPMQYDKTRVIPNLSAQVPTGTPRISFFFGIHPDAKLPAGDGKLDMDVQRDGKSVSRSSSVIARSAGSDSSLNLASIQARSLAPGSYRAVFTYTQADKTSSRDLAFTVVGDQIAANDRQPESLDATSEAASGNSGNADPDPSPDADSATASRALLDLAPGRFTPSPLSSSSRPPGKKYLSSLIESARKRAIGYLDALVNFKCIEVTDRFIDPKGKGNWTRHDKLAEMVTFENHQESRDVIEVNGEPGNTQSYDMKGARLEGEFGRVLKAVFSPSSSAEFTWKETDSLDGGSAQVFTYSVDARNSQFTVTSLPEKPVYVSFHGLVYIDDATRGVRRVTMEADAIPAGTHVRASALGIDYDYVAINNHDYLMPVEGELHMKLGKHREIMHRIEFRDYHRFGSDARIVGVKPQ